MTPLIYLVDDDDDLREAILDTFASHKIPSKGFSRATQVLDVLDPEWAGVVLADIRMPGMNGLELLEAAKKAAPDVPVILFTGHADVPMAVDAIQNGAYDFLEKPVHPDRLHQVVLRALKMRHMQIELSQLKQKLSPSGNLKDVMIGRSKSIREVRRAIRSVAPLDVNVLLWGEDGAGKSLAARCLHDLSGGEPNEFVVVNCAALREDTMERVIFEPGGLLDQSRNGTLYLQNPQALPDALQAQLIRVFEPQTALKVVVSVSKRPEDLVAEGALRSDLFYRINVAQIEIPPLRERGRDVFQLLEHFVRSAAVRHNRPLHGASTPDLDQFATYRWPGNVRELINVAEKLTIGLPVVLGDAPPKHIGDSYDDAMVQFERDLLSNALLQTAGRKGEAADLLGIPRKRLYLRMKHCGLE